MKKTSIFLLFAASVSFAMFQSCAGNSAPKDGMQEPVAEAAAGNEAKENDDSENESGEGASASAKTADVIAVNYQNMQDAFKGETTASAKYAAYSKKAEQEGYHEIALLFMAASKSENIHANNHKAVLEDANQKVPVITPEFTVKATGENLKDAIAGETYEITTMYPQFITNANTAGNQLSQISLNYAYKTEQKHKVFYEKALAALESNSVKSLPSTYYVCPTCGNTYDTTTPKRCGISMTNSEKFIKVIDLNS